MTSDTGLKLRTSDASPSGADAIFLSGGGEVGEVIRRFDWAASPLGPPERWPSALKTAVSLMLGASQPVYIGWGPGLVSLYNDAYLPIVGTKHPGIGKPFRKLWAEIWDDFAPLVEVTMRGEGQHFVDLPVALAGRPGVPLGYFTFSYTPLRGDDGTVNGFYCAATETTEQVLAAAALKTVSAQLAAREGQLTAAINDAPVGVAIFDNDMRYIAVSKGFEQDYQRLGQSFIGRSHYELFPDVPDRWRDIHRRVLAGEEQSCDRDCFTDGANPVWLRWHMKPWRNASGDVGGAVLFSEMIADRLAEEERLREAERRYRAIFDQAAVGIARVAPDGHFLEVNERWSQICGYSRQELLTGDFQQITHPDDLGADLDSVAACLRGEISSYSMEKRYFHKDGRTIWVNLAVALVRTADGEPAYFASVVEDISDKKQALEEATRAMERATIAQVASRSSLYEFFPKTGQVLRNENAHPVVGFKVDELGPGKDAWRKLIHPDDLPRFDSAVARAIQSGDRYELEYRARHSDGHWVWISDLAQIIRDPSGDAERWVGLVTDISERRAAQEREQLLSREVDHRAKNLLAVVQSVVQLTRADNSEQLKDAILGRIQALARTHSLLANARWDGVRIGEVIHDELQPYLGAEDRVKIDGPAILLRPSAAQSLAMVVHELATNAAKYGALSVPEGRVEISWRRSGNLIELGWSEHGGPPVRKPDASGFGSKIIRASVERQLDGSLDQEWRPYGIRYAIRICATAEAGAAT